MSIEKNIRHGVSAAVIIAASTSLASDITIANAEKVDNKVGTVTTSALNVRKGPGTNNSIVTKIYKNNKITILEESNGWYKVKLSNGKTGWCSGEYIKISNGSSSNVESNNNSNIVAEENKVGVVNTSSLNVRKGAGTNYSVVGSVKSGQKVGILSSKSGWYNVLLPNGNKGWVSGKYLNITNGDPNSVIQQSTNQSNGNTSQSNAATKAVELAKKQIGKPYGWGAEGPNSFDCSGLTYYSYKKQGITLPRTSSAQASAGKKVSKSDLKPGDLVFFNTNGKGVSHVGIYVGGGNMVHSTKPGENVKTTSINSSYYKSKFVTARRVV